MSNSNKQDISGELVEMMRLLPFPIAIVTTSAGHRKRGATIGSFTSLSMEPPLISFNVIQKTTFHEVLETADRFIVHIPGYEQRELCTHFAISDLDDEEQFQDLDYDESLNGPPLLKNMVAEIHCKSYHRFSAGDHSIFAGQVESIRRNRAEPALLYLDGGYVKVDTI